MAAGSHEYAKKLTEYLRKYDSNWTIEQTRQMLDNAKSSGMSVNLVSGDGGMARIQIMGDTVLVNGKDITGNLGSKITYGDNSPIIGDIRDSSVNIGSNNAINNQYQILFDQLGDLRKQVSKDSSISQSNKVDINGDIETIQSQLGKEKPNPNIIQSAWEGVKTVLKVYGYAKTIAEISMLIARFFL